MRKTIQLFANATLLMFSVIALITPMSSCSAASRVEATNVEPKPNYALTQDRNDLVQLTDGRFASYPLWTNQEAVGWARTTPILLWLTLHGDDPAKVSFSGLLRIHTVARSKSGIFVPKRVDVYASSDGNMWSHVRGVQVNPSNFEDGEEHWVEMEIGDVPPKLLVIVHANGEYFFADEFQWQDLPLPPVTAVREEINGYRQAVGHSLSRLKEVYAASARGTHEQISEWSTAFSGEQLIAWVESPWDALIGNPSVSHIESGMERNVRMFGARDEIESGCIGVLIQESTEVDISITLRGSPSVVAALKVFQIIPVAAADGTMVYDALVPYSFGESVRLPALSASYFWITVDMSRLPVGTHKATVEIVGAALKKDIDIDITVANVTIKSNIVKGIAWGYPDDRPIWQHPADVAHDVISHGVNVHVIPPSRIPRPRGIGVVTPGEFKPLIDTVRLYEARGTFLLFLDWSPDRLADRRMEWLHPDTGVSASKRREILARWLEGVSGAMQTAGVSWENWALYPVDEFSGKHVEYLRELFSLLKSIQPSPRIYANPIDTPSNPTQIRDLIALARDVDIWQPEISFAEHRGQEFFKSLPGKWWVYMVPRSPAKSVLPLSYRILAWRAWSIGATGIGFWSYSDTRGTSAWNDMDGSVPDWAVVYDGEPVVSSRRWEAFREGIEDLRLLQLMHHGGAVVPEGGSTLANTMRFGDIERLRMILLGFEEEGNNLAQ